MPAESMKNSIGIEFLLIHAGDFWMYPKGYGHEETVHKVTIEEPFYLGKYPVTQQQWKTVMGTETSCFEGDNRPVECVSWNDVQEFISRLNTKEDTDKYRLPSEAEWEYACRAGTTTRYSFGNDESELDEYAWYYENSGHNTQPVGRKKPNPWGLYDMHGNVWEWCQDKCHKRHKKYEFATVGGGIWKAGSITGQVLRGGSWVNFARKCRSAYCSSFNPAYGYYSLGFRLLREI